MSIFFKLLRINQWIKNFLIFAPLIFAKNFEINNYYSLLDVFFSFSLICSAMYIFNDLVDLENDKIHPTKKFRPIANGDIKILNSKIIAILLILISFSYIYFFEKKELIFIFALYLVLNLIYTFFLKKKFLLDVVILVSFYIIRIYIGSISSEIVVSFWLILCSLFFFASLAFLKRANDINKYSYISNFNRGYNSDHLNLIKNLFIFCGILTIIIFVFYINFSNKIYIYDNILGLYFIPFILYFFYNTLYKQLNKKEIKDDPTIHIVSDKKILFLLFCIFVVYSFN